MADTKISDEAAAGTLTGAELVLAVQSGANVRTTTGAIAALTSSDWLVTQLTASATLSAVTQIVEVDATAGNVVLTLPSAATSEGVRYIIKQIDSSENTITLDPNGTDQVEAGGAGTNYLIPESGSAGSWSVYCSGSAWWRSDYVTPTPAVTSAATWTITESGAAPSYVADEVQLFALQVGGRTELQARASDGEITQLTRARVRTGITTSFTFGDGDEIIYISTGSGAVTGTLPNPANHAGRQYLVWKTNTGTNKFTAARYASEKINGVAASYDTPGSATAYVGCWHLSCDGTDWFVSGGAIS